MYDAHCHVAEHVRTTYMSCSTCIHNHSIQSSSHLYHTKSFTLYSWNECCFALPTASNCRTLLCDSVRDSRHKHTKRIRRTVRNDRSRWSDSESVYKVHDCVLQRQIACTLEQLIDITNSGFLFIIYVHIQVFYVCLHRILHSSQNQLCNEKRRHQNIVLKL